MSEDQETQRSLAFELNSTTDVWLVLKRHYLELRGAKPGKNGKAIPQTTGRDVMAMAVGWQKEFSKVNIENDRDRRELVRFQSLLSDIATYARPNELDAQYSRNQAFWDETKRTALYLESRKVRPSTWSVVKESVGEAVDELPTTLSQAAAATRGLVTKILSEPMKWLVLAGGVVLVPVVIRHVQKNNQARRRPRLRAVRGMPNVYDVVDEREVGS